MERSPLFRISGLITVSSGILIWMCGCLVTLPGGEREKNLIVSLTEFKDGGGYGRVLSIGSEYGNINTEFTESDIKTLGIEANSYFRVKYNINVYEVYLGENYDDVPEGNWVALWRDGRLRIARNLENAAQTLGCKKDEILFIQTISH